MATNSEADPEALAQRLEEFRTAINSLPDIERPPQTTPQILGQGYIEAIWHNYLSYFLDPSEPHGFDDLILQSFLDCISEHLDSFEYTKSQLHDISIESENQTSEGNRPDIVIFPNDKSWFVCIEMKVRSGRGPQQLERYYADEEIADFSKEEFGSDHYVYLANEQELGYENFTLVPWREVVDSFSSILSFDFGNVPFKTIAQFSEFLDTIREETGMVSDPSKKIQREKKDLYLQYIDEIDEAKQAFKMFYEDIKEDWKQIFLDKFMPESWDESWNCNPNRYGQIYKSSWRFDEDLNPVLHSDTEDSWFKLHFIHRIRDFSSFNEGRLTFQLKTPTKVDFRPIFGECLEEQYQENDEFQAWGNRNDAEMKVGNKVVRTEIIYNFDRTGLPDEYFATLRKAFEDHQAIVPYIDRAVKNAKERHLSG